MTKALLTKILIGVFATGTVGTVGLVVASKVPATAQYIEQVPVLQEYVDLVTFTEKEEGLTEEENLFCKIIRDADKLDIFYVLCNYDFESAFWYKDFKIEEVSKEIMHELKDIHKLDYGNIKNNADQIAVPFAYTFDLNFEFSLRYLKEKRYLDEFTKLVCEQFKSKKVHEQTREMLEYVNKYIEENI